MNVNVGTVDRGVRIVVGVILIALIFILQSDWRWIGLIGIIPLGTALMGRCPLYSVLGISSCKTKTTSP